MKSIIQFGVSVFALALAVTAHATTITYSPTDISGNTWQYNYSITNNTQPANIGEFNVLFAQGQYSNLSVAASPGNWISTTTQPTTNPIANGIFDSQALDVGLAPGQAEGGFSVQFTWLGTGAPGSQTFNVVDPNTSVTLESGNTTLATPVPLPAAAWLMLSGLGGLGAFLRKKRAAAYCVDLPTSQILEPHEPSFAPDAV